MRELSRIAAYEPERMPTVLQSLIIERMAADKTMSEFLDENTFKMGEDTDTLIWKQYKSLGKDYSNLVHRIKLAEHYIKQGK